MQGHRRGKERGFKNPKVRGFLPGQEGSPLGSGGGGIGKEEAMVMLPQEAGAPCSWEKGRW